MQPTRNQVEELWRWCGFTIEDKAITRGSQLVLSRCKFPNGHRGYVPTITLDHLFEWAVLQKLKKLKLRVEYDIDFSLVDLGAQPTHYWAIKKNYHTLVGTGESQDPALALFWAIYKLIDSGVVATT